MTKDQLTTLIERYKDLKPTTSLQIELYRWLLVKRDAV